MLQPNSALNILWWGIYTVVGVWLQRWVPGIDFYAAGLVLALQEGDNYRTITLGVVWSLLLEGTGSLPFGYALAWYGLLTLGYMAGCVVFESKSIVFMLLIGLGLGILHPVLIYGLAALTDLEVDMHPIWIEGIMQAVSFPLIWLLLDNLYPKRLRQDVRPL